LAVLFSVFLKAASMATSLKRRAYSFAGNNCVTKLHAKVIVKQNRLAQSIKDSFQVNTSSDLTLL
jgi:hypothetical protein